MRGTLVNHELDIAANRRSKKYGERELAARALWALFQPLFRYSPRLFFAWRRWLLRCFGAKVGRSVRIENSVRIKFPWLLQIGDFAAIGEGARIYNLGPVTIGPRATVSQLAHLCAGTHDYSDPRMPLQRPPIVIGQDAWVCADAFIGPNVIVGDGAVVGARAAVFENVKPWTIVGGNPARFLKERTVVSDSVASQSGEHARGQSNSSVSS